jgi:hypothetical protein
MRNIAIAVREESFYAFLTRKKTNRRYLLLALCSTIILFILFKIAYPFPDFISDSYDYIESAAFHLDVNLWPVGYAKFLWLIHKINHSDTFLVGVQYFILQAALAYLFFIVLWLFRPSRISSNVLFVFLLLNPLSLYLSNSVLSDAIFSALTIIWLVQLILQFIRPRAVPIFLMAIVIALAFTIRYTAIYYPVITGLPLLLSRHKTWMKIAGTVAPVALMVPFVLFTEAKTKAITGTAEFSVFGGWQLANNAIYMYDHIQVNPNDLPVSTRSLDSMVRQYFKSVPPGYIDLDHFPGTFFIKHPDAPLKQYMIRHYRKEMDSSDFLSWGKVSPIYNAYGSYLIRHYPFSFARYYLLLNTKNYFTPYLEKFGSYNVMKDSVWSLAQYWFRYKTPAVRSVSKEFQGSLFFFYPSIFMVLNLYFGGCLIWLLFSGKIRRLDPIFHKTLYLITGFILVNFIFSIFATPVVLRYQIIPMLFLFIFSVLLFEITGLNEPGEVQQGQKKISSKKVKILEGTWLTFGVLVPIGLLGASFCMVILIIEIIIKILTFSLLAMFALSSLVYGYILRKYNHWLFHSKLT